MDTAAFYTNKEVDHLITETEVMLSSYKGFGHRVDLIVVIMFVKQAFGKFHVK